MADRAAIWNLHVISRLSHVPARFDADVRGKVRALEGVTSVAAAPSHDASTHLAFSAPYAQVVGTAVAATQCLHKAVDEHNAQGGVAGESTARGRAGSAKGGVARRSCAPSPPPRRGRGSCSVRGVLPRRCCTPSERDTLATKETTMAPWQAYGHRHVHGIGLETAQGHAHIEGGYADQHLRVTVQVGAQPAQHRRVATMAQAQAWAEAQLRDPLVPLPAGEAGAGSVGTSVSSATMNIPSPPPSAKAK